MCFVSSMMAPMPSVRQGTGRGGTGSGVGTTGGMRGTMSRGEYGKQRSYDQVQLPPSSPFYSYHLYHAEPYPFSDTADNTPFTTVPQQIYSLLGLPDFHSTLRPELGQVSDWFPVAPMLTLTL
jgi:hypothetical protein